MNQEFAGYSITRSMSGGGMTKLYVAIDAQQTRYVIRVLDAVMAKERKNRSRFFYGGEVIARLNSPKPNPNIVRFIKAGYEGKIPYMILEYIESRTLRDLFNKETKEVVVDDFAVHESMVAFAERLMPEHVGRIKRFEGERPNGFIAKPYAIDEFRDKVVTLIQSESPTLI